FSSRRRHTRSKRDWSSDVCSSDLSWTEQGNQMANRDNSDPSGLGNTLGWAWAWPLNRRVLYNRASADINGKPWDPKRMLIQWNRSEERRVGKECRAREWGGGAEWE